MMKRIFLSAVVLGLFACSLPSRSPVTPTAFMVNPERSGEPLKSRSSLWLKIGSVSVAPPYDGRSLVYRLGDQRFEKDFYNVYTTLPADMIANAERQWINKSGIFSAAVGQSNSFFPYYTLQATVNEFYGDYRVRPEAVVSMEFFLTVTNSGKGNPLIGSNRYTKRIALKDNTPEALVMGQQQALAEIFREYEVQLDKYAANLPKPIGY
ncbi:membrane integrity-associated transporter subunit PqiC [Polynucleobacter sp. MWH-Berg-3C6]|uniref:PqiC family protein n=1 Tax=Polynucleobacter sp. MWH-Berg-3C6 TaxID=1855882 RepID=UPI001C0B6891|nr:ABC-type transport auxiliary lipoprotein family protein [Polynucleobacter sp. MWH-Berg-3C6]MBU3550664.1 membrane integrity-associated transporter subunit PqiC [Polynucleobacter sp. MWH-Berg-3C6]